MKMTSRARPTRTCQISAPLDVPAGYKLIAPSRSGGQSAVFLLARVQDAKLVVLKEPQKSKTLKSEFDLLSKTLKETQSSNIVKPLLFVQSSGGMVLEWATSDLFDMVKQSRTKVKPVLICKIAEDMKSALQGLNNVGFVHMDIKPENILVFIDKRASMYFKLSDMGFAREINARISKKPGSRPYAAPELLVPGELIVTPVCDLWSLAVTLLVTCSARLPWVQSSSKDDEYVSFWSMAPETRYAHIPAEVTHYIEPMLRIAPLQRQWPAATTVF
jgi:serine/threonine protein kinase